MHKEEILSSYFYLYPEERKYAGRIIFVRYLLRSLKQTSEREVAKLVARMASFITK